MTEYKFRQLFESEQVKWLYNNISKLTLEQFQDYLDIYYKEKEWNDNCD